MRSIWNGDHAASFRKLGIGAPLARSPDDPSGQFGSWHRNVCQFVLGDGSVRAIPVSTDLTTLHRLADACQGNPLFLAEIIDEGELRAQLDHARQVRFTKKELIWLAGNSFYGSKQIFSPEFLRWLEGFRLPEYQLSSGIMPARAPAPQKRSPAGQASPP